MKKWQSISIDSRLIILNQAVTQLPSIDKVLREGLERDLKAWLQAVEPIARAKLANPLTLPGPTGEENKLSLQGRGPMALVITEQDRLIDAEKQIVSALLCGCAAIISAADNHLDELKQLVQRYVDRGVAGQLLPIEPLRQLPELIGDNRVEGVIANSLNADSSVLRQTMAQRSGSIIPLIEWPQRNEDYSYHWLLWFLSERTRTENLVARGGNTQLFNLAE